MEKQITLSFSKTEAEINCLYSGEIPGISGIKNISDLLLNKAERSNRFLIRLKKRLQEKSC